MPGFLASTVATLIYEDPGQLVAQVTQSRQVEAEALELTVDSRHLSSRTTRSRHGVNVSLPQRFD